MFALLPQWTVFRGRRQAQDFPRPLERMLQVGANVFTAQPIQETCLVHHEQRLGMRPAQDQVFLALVQPLVKVFQGIEARGINRQGFSHAQNQHLWLLPGTFQRRFQLVRSAKEKRPKDAVNHHAFGHRLANE